MFEKMVSLNRNLPEDAYTFAINIDLPGWLAALEKEVQQQEFPERWRDYNSEPDLIDPIIVSIANLKEQLEQLPRRQK